MNLRGRISVFLITLLAVLIVLVGCNNEPEVSGYTTPSIMGTVSLPSDSGFEPSDVWVKVCETGAIFKVGKDGHFLVHSLEEDRTYTLEFSTATPSNATPKDIHASNYATRVANVKGYTGSGNNIGYVVMRPVGIVTGNIRLYGSTDNSGIMVSAIGASYSSFTESDGSFTIADLPEGTYTFSFSKDGYISASSGEITVLASDEKESPVITLDNSYLYSVDSTARIEGKVSYSDRDDASGIVITLSDKN